MKAGDRDRTDDIQLGKLPENPADDTKATDSRHPPSTGPSNCAHDLDGDLEFVSANWDRLSNALREAIVAIVLAGL